MSTKVFNPNQLSFDEGIERIRRAIKQKGLDMDGRIVTSRDEGAEQLRTTLAVTAVPPGFRKWQLPVYLSAASQLYITVAEPGASAPQHSHDDGEGFRFIASGSIFYEGRELTAGDWMYVPAGAPYSFTVGPVGALMCYCYCCSCAQRD